jgi:N-acetylmuramoyl-L-alanine amidase
VALLVALGSCRREAPLEERPRASIAPSAAGAAEAISEGRIAELTARAHAVLGGAVLPPRGETAIFADELAVAAARLGSDAQSLRLAKAAADLRTRMWRIGHREDDARDAIELYAGVARDAMTQGLLDDGCAAARARAMVVGELARDPERLYRELYAVQRIFTTAGCQTSCARDLTTLAAHRPASAVLAGLDEQATKFRAQALARRAESAATAPVLSADESGVVLAPPRTAGAASPVKVLSIDPYGSKDRARVVVTLSGPTSFRAGDLAGPRLFLDLERTEPSSRSEVAVSGLVGRLRQLRRPGVGKKEDTTRILLDLAVSAHRRIFYLPEPFRVVIDLATHEAPSVTAPPGSPRQVTRVAIDAGHGGSDPGAIGPTGLREKDVTLAVAHLVAPMLSSELGILTMLTRDDDRLVPLDERAARANAFHADLFVSIHCNASENTAAHGVMSFVLDTTRDEIANAIAARENATSIAATSQAATITSSLRLADLGARSTHLAELLQHAAMSSLTGFFSDVADQGVKRAGFFVLVGAEMPSVLFETAFISNPWEERRLASPEYRRRLAVALTSAVRAYREGL